MKAGFILLAICLLNSMQMAHAFCNEPQPRLVCAEYFDSAVVFEATLLKIDDVLYENHADDIIARHYTLRTDRPFRGTIPQTFKVYEGNDSGRASFNWKVGTRYVLFLSGSLEMPNEQVLDGCGKSGPVSHARSVLREVQRINPSSQSALISGVVSDYYHSGPEPDVQVLARGDGRVFKAPTDRNGRFKIEVPPGEYVVEAVQASLSFKVSEFSYEDPKHLAMKAGSCAQVQFIETSQR